MRLKTQLYPEQQRQINDELINVLNLNEDISLILHELDMNKELQEQIMNFLPKIHTYFSMSTITTISCPEKIKIPYLSIIRHLLKDEYQILSTEYKIKVEPKPIRTKKYYFIKKVADRQDIKIDYCSIKYTYTIMNNQEKGLLYEKIETEWLYQ